MIHCLEEVDPTIWVFKVVCTYENWGQQGAAQLNLFSCKLLRFSDDGAAPLCHPPPGCLFGTADVHLSLHHGPTQPQTSARHHRSTGGAYGKSVLCPPLLSDGVNSCEKTFGSCVRTDAAATCQVWTSRPSWFISQCIFFDQSCLDAGLGSMFVTAKW